VTRGRSTGELCLKAGLRDAGVLDEMPDRGVPPGCVRVAMPMLAAFGGEGRPVPDLRSELDRAVLARVLGAAPPLESRDGWHVHSGRWLNATDDRAHFGRAGLPVLEGKLLDPFRARVSDASTFIERAAAERLLRRRTAIDRPRLGYREVASATNRLTLIAAVVPAGVVTTHPLFCLRERLDEESEWFLCGVFTSYVANYCVRLRGGTHVAASVIQRLPVPFDAPPAAMKSIATLSRALADEPRAEDAARLHADVARLYGLAREEFAHVLSTFPLVPPSDRVAALQAFDATAI